MANPKRHARLLTDGKISNQHVIHDFDASEGDKIDLSHIIQNAEKEIIKFRKNSIKGKGVEIQFSPGAKVLSRNQRRVLQISKMVLRIHWEKFQELSHRSTNRRGRS